MWKFEQALGKISSVILFQRLFGSELQDINLTKVQAEMKLQGYESAHRTPGTPFNLSLSHPQHMASFHGSQEAIASLFLIVLISILCNENCQKDKIYQMCDIEIITRKQLSFKMRRVRLLIVIKNNCKLLARAITRI